MFILFVEIFYSLPYKFTNLHDTYADIICVILESRTVQKLKRGSTLRTLHEYAEIDTSYICFSCTVVNIIPTYITKLLQELEFRPHIPLLQLQNSTMCMFNSYNNGFTLFSHSFSFIYKFTIFYIHLHPLFVTYRRIQNNKPLDEIVQNSGLFEEKVPDLYDNNVQTINILHIITEQNVITQ